MEEKKRNANKTVRFIWLLAILRNRCEIFAHSVKLKIQFHFHFTALRPKKKSFKKTDSNEKTKIYVCYLHATVKSISPDTSSSARPNIHFTLPLLFGFTRSIETPHSPSFSPRPKYLYSGFLSHSWDNRIPCGTPGSSNLKFVFQTATTNKKTKGRKNKSDKINKCVLKQNNVLINAGKNERERERRENSNESNTNIDMYTFL